MVIERRAARTLLISDASVLLIKGRDPNRPDRGAWWLVPGGGIEEGESVEAAAVREVFEETGLRLTPEQLGPVVATRVATFEFDGRAYHQAEWFFAAFVSRFTPHRDGWDATEQRALLDHRWWSADALRRTDEALYPGELAELLEALLGGRLTTPFELGPG